MKNYSLTLAKNQMDLLLEMYGPYQVETNIPHAIFQAKKADISLIFYQNGTLLIKGEFQEELRLIKNRLGLINFSAIGSDEVGTGDLFGPIVVCSAYVSADDIEKLEAMGVRDSKNITDRQIIELAPKLSKC